MLALARLAYSTIAEIQRADPALGNFLVDKIAAERKAAIVSGLKGSSAALVAAVQKITFSPASPTGATTRQAIDAALATQKVGPAILREAAQKLDKLERSGHLADMADPATPIAQHPLFASELKEAALYLLTDNVHLSGGKAERLVALAGSPALVDDDMLASLVADKSLTAAEAASLGLMLSLCLLTGDNAALAVAIKPKIETLPDVGKVSAEEWLEAITRAKAEPPKGLDAADYAAALRRASTNLYPIEALHALTIPADLRPLQRALAAVAPLAAKNPDIFGPEFDELDTSAVSAEQLPAVKAAQQHLKAFVNQHPGLGLADVLNGHEAPADKIGRVSARLAVLTKLRALNPDHEFMGLDYTEGSADRETLKTDGLSPSDQHMAVADLKAAQRVHALTKEVDHTSAIMAAGYASASAVAIDHSDEFQRKTGLSHSIARHYHKKSASALSRASHAVISARDAYDGPFDRTRAGNAHPDIKDHLKAIPGFSDLFGSQDYCNCTECQSILGAAAYFVDLMTFVEENMTGPAFRGKKAKDPLNLRVRRPDLWTLPLTCDNTNDLVSYLDIINPTLEDYIAGQHLGRPGRHHEEHRAGHGREHRAGRDKDHRAGRDKDHRDGHRPDHRAGRHIEEHTKRRAARDAARRGARHDRKGGSTERPSAETLVYQDVLSKSQASFNQPFTLPLEKLDIYLEHFSIPRVQIARALGADPAVIVKAALKISDAVYHQLKDANPDQEFLKRVYGIAFAFTGAAAHVNALNVTDMMQATGFSRPDFEAAATTRFVTKTGAYKVRIHSEKKNAESEQNDLEKISGLTSDALHRLYRFTRLLSTLPWSISELDMILAQLDAAEKASGLDETALQRLVQILELRARWSIPVDQLCALWSPIPAELFDRLFNFPPLLGLDRKLPQSDAKFVHAALSHSGTAYIFMISHGMTPATDALRVSYDDKTRPTDPLPVSHHDATRAKDPREVSHHHHDTTRATDLQQNVSQRILAGLHVSDSDLIFLIAGLANTVGINLASHTENELGLALSEHNLSLLYRHAMLARLLNLSVSDLFQLIQLAHLPHEYVETLDDLISLLEFYDWYKASGYQLDDLATITHGKVLNPASYPDPGALARNLALAVAKDHSLEFADKVFVLLLGVTEAESQQMIAGNGHLFDLVKGAATPTFRLTAAVHTGAALQFFDTVFAFQLGVTEQQSQQIVAANPTLFTVLSNSAPPSSGGTTASSASGTNTSPPASVAVVAPPQSGAITAPPASLPGPAPQASGTTTAPQASGSSTTQTVSLPNPAPVVLLLSAAFGPDTKIAIPDGIALDHADAHAALVRYSAGAGGAAATGSPLLNYHPIQVIPSALAGLLGVDFDTLTVLLAMTGVDLSSAEIFRALQLSIEEITTLEAPTNPPPPEIEPLCSLVEQVVPLKVLFAAPGFSATDLPYIQQKGGLFGITNFNTLSISSVRKLSVYASFATNLAAYPAGTTPLRDVLSAFSSAAHFSQAAPTELAVVLGIDPKLLPSLLPHLTLPPTVPEALTSLSSISALAKSLGLGGEALRLIISEDYSDQTRASVAILAAFRAQFHDDQQFLDRCQPFDDRIRARKRDALTDYLLTWNGYRFCTLDDLYNYFLLDVQLEGCMETSWVVAAISSVQLYVYRCLLNLEQDQRDPDDPAHIHVTVGTEAVEEWEWRQNYRVWQANREVFLFPESYTLPELRDDMTPLFEELLSSFQQNTIDPETVLDTYSTYMAGFDQLSKLRIAGSYHEIDTDSTTDVLHLFGVTPQDPPTFFYRTIENANHGETETDRAVSYTPWVPVNLQIHCREVSPIVYLGRLFVFWTQTTTVPQNLVVNANSIFNGYKHTWRVKYSSLRLDQIWTPPQQLALTDTTVFPQGDGIVLDSLLDIRDKLFLGYDANTSLLIASLAATNPTQDQSNEKNTYTTWLQGYGYRNVSLSLPWYQGTLVPLYADYYDLQTAAVDGYTVTGFQWERVYPTLSEGSQDMLLTGRNFLLRAEGVDFYKQALAPTNSTGDGRAGQVVICSKSDQEKLNRDIYTGLQDYFPKLERYPWCSIVSQEERIQKLAQTQESADLYLPNMQEYFASGSHYFAEESATLSHGEPLKRGLYKKRIASVPGDPDIAVVNSSARDAITDAIIDIDADVLHLQGSVRPGDYVMKRMTTTLGENLCRALFVNGVDGLLSFETQSSLRESKPELIVVEGIQDEVVVGEMDFTGAMGTYFREVFFHAPFLIASQLNGQQNFAAAQQWYRYIFDPTATDDVANEEKEKRPSEGHSHEGKHDDHRRDERREDSERASRDRVWRFIEFRNQNVPSLRKILTDAAAIKAYEQDPFNPFAIARLRLSAFQKCIVMDYVDNLIDWGDSLFTEFTMESVNEGTPLYVQAREILGRQPEDIGDCGEGDEDQRTYEHIAPLVKKGSDFLVEMETYTHTGTGAARAQPKRRPKHKFTLGHAVASHNFKEAANAGRRRASEARRTEPTEQHKGHAAHGAEDYQTEIRARSAGGEDHRAPKARAERGAAHPYNWKGMHSSSRSPSGGEARKGSGRRKGSSRVVGRHGSRFAWSVARHVIPAFCVPPNEELLAYWDTVEDRLYKIRHGMDITGALRQLSLFAPPINPLLLVEATAAGLSLDDVTNATSGDAPPYRFTYLIDKAKQFASQVQSFGGAVLSAIEKRDAQQLEVLRVTQQQNILGMTTSTKQAEIDSAQHAIDTLSAQLDTAQVRHDYFQGLVETGLNPWEITQTTANITSSTEHTTASILATLNGTFGLLPNLGSPFAITWGGEQLTNSLTGFAEAMRDIATVAEAVASSAGLAAGFERRSDGWQHEVDMATMDITQITTQLQGANSRLTIAQKALDIHNATIAQQQKIADFYTSRFSNVALYTWLATTMKTTYRQAYNCAFAMAQLAQMAYQFERNDDQTIFIGPTYWSQAQGGLLAGEQLLGDLQRLEQTFLATNYRTPEITQSFSMMQIAPAALLSLRQNASCNFSIPELAFNLFYPGHYCRRIKAVRLTIPCVAGPLTNVGATLTLTNSQIRLKPTSDLTPIQLKHSTMIWLSTAQNDTGVFEFSFRDERYMPFEGAGAISSWTVELPDGFRNFDYQTVTDVIFQVSYTSRYDGRLRRTAEAKLGAIAKALSQQPLARLFSLRQEFPTVLNRLLHSAANTGVTLTIGANCLPFFIVSTAIQVTRAAMVLRTAPLQAPSAAFAISLDGTSATNFSNESDLGGLPSSDVTSVFSTGLFGDHTLMIANAGNLAPATAQPPSTASVDDTKLLDVMLYVEYKPATN